MAYKQSLLELQIDQFSRQHMVFQLVKSARGSKKLKILDVGGHLGKTTEFFSDDSVTVTDLYDVKKKNYVKASALDLPFQDNEFDVVVSFDVLEHIAEKNRKKFLEEVSRVSADIVAIAAPFDTELVSQVEKEVNQSFKKIYGKNHPWLEEHIDNGLPDITMITEFFKKNQFVYSTYTSNNLFLWKTMMNFYFICGNSRLSTLSKKLNRFYNENNTLLGDHTGPSYRKIIFARKNVGTKKELPHFESIIDNAVYNELLERLSKGTIAILEDKQKSIEQAAAIREHTVRTEMTQEMDNLRNTLDEIAHSKAWKITSPIRQMKRKLKK